MSNDTRLGDVLSDWTDLENPPQVTQNIQVWRVHLQECRCLVESLAQLLDEDEHSRISRTRIGETREQFIVGRAVLRLLLGNALAVAPAAIRFSKSEHGKLELAPSQDLYFNVTHSREMILLALSRSGRIGIDVESLDRAVDVMEVAQTAFSRGEILQLQQRPAGADRLLAFFRCWTRKEAVVKADGCGLGVPLKEFSVPMIDGVGGDVQLPPHERCACDTLRVGEIIPAAGYIGALAGFPRDQQVIGHSLSPKALTRLIYRASR